MSVFTNIERDLCKRTLENLKYIEGKINDNKNIKLYEVTQLFNSLLGIVINIKENEKWKDEWSVFSDFPDMNFSQGDSSICEKWGIPNRIRPIELSRLIYNMRNSVAHMGIKFKPEDEKEINFITGIEFKFLNDGGDYETMEFKVEELRKFIEQLCNYIQTH